MHTCKNASEDVLSGDNAPVNESKKKQKISTYT